MEKGMTSTIRRIAVVTTLMAAVVVALGAYTRLKDAGLGCPDWPGCYGFLTVPEHIDDVKIAEARFPESPVEAHKGWPEMIHRYFASGLGLLIIIQAVLCVRYFMRFQKENSNNRAAQSPPLKLPLFLVLLVICQGLFGMWTVTLKLWPQVVSGHLLGGFATLSLLFLLALRVFNQPNLDTSVAPSNVRKTRFSPWAVVGLLLVIIQVFLGAWTASNYAAVACPDFPTCQGVWWPEMNLQAGFNLFQHIGPNYLGGLMDGESRVAIQMIHRVGALLLTIYLVLMSWRLWGRSVRPVKAALVFVLAALTMQVSLGIINVLWLIPLPIAVAHNAGGAVLLLSVVYLNFKLYGAYQSEAIKAQSGEIDLNITKTAAPQFANNAEVTS